METTVQGVMQAHFPDYAKSRRLPLWQHKAARAMIRCGTALMGSHTEHCPGGDYDGVIYHSCHHRSCARCNGQLKSQWLDKVSSRLLPCDHFHVILTLPHELIALWRYNRAWFHDQLFGISSDSLRTLLRDERYLGAEPGMLLALHTWGRTLNVHPHIHALVSAGGLHNGEWRSNDKGYLLPVEALRVMYRGKWLGALSRALDAGTLVLPPDWSAGYTRWVFRKLARTKWNVRIERRYSHGKGVAIYLSRYARGGPVSNERLIDMDQSRIRLRYWDHQHQRNDTIALELDRFIGRVLSHVPVPAQHTVRYYGLYVPKAQAKRAAARRALGASRHEDAPVKPSSERRCRLCGRVLIRTAAPRAFENSNNKWRHHTPVQQSVEVDRAWAASPPPRGPGNFFARGRPLN